MQLSNTIRCAALAAILTLFAAPSALAGVSASKAFLCAVTETVDCGSDGSCSRGSAEDVDLPPFIWVDVPKGQLRAHQGERTTKIARKEQRDGTLILQGVEVRAWSISIDEATGKLTAAAAGDSAGFVLFGNCTNP